MIIQSRAQDKRKYLMIIFLIAHQNYMLWSLIGTVSSRWFRWGVITYVFMQNWQKLSLIITKYSLLSRALKDIVQVPCHCHLISYPLPKIDHEIFSTVIFPLPLIQEGKLSVTGKSGGTEYWVNHLGGLSLPRKSEVRLTDSPYMIIAVYMVPTKNKKQNSVTFPW